MADYYVNIKENVRITSLDEKNCPYITPHIVHFHSVNLQNCTWEMTTNYVFLALVRNYFFYNVFSSKTICQCKKRTSWEFVK